VSQSEQNLSPSNPILTLENVSYSYPNGVKALHEIHMEIHRGSKIAILGANGAGKSTLFLHLNGILQPQSGHILLDGQRIKYTRIFLSELRKKVGIVFQDPDSQLFSVNVFQDISFGPMNLKYPPAEIKARVEQAMEITKTSDLRGRPTHQLSYGQKKRVAIAGILAMDPEVIILDEPTASLDPCLVEEMMLLFEQLYKDGKTLIIATHDMDLAYSWVDYCYILNQGKVDAQGSPPDIFRNQALLINNNLQIPWVLKVFAQMVGKGLIDKRSQPPHNEEQLFTYLDNISKNLSGSS
jgi:cobalt/nickel transport system ATP-binding protein